MKITKPLIIKNKSTPVVPAFRMLLYSGRFMVKWKNTTIRAATPLKASSSWYRCGVCIATNVAPLLTFTAMLSKRILTAATIILALTGLLYLTIRFTREHFPSQGEAYFKGPGHLLRQDFFPALSVIIIRQLSLSTLLFFVIFSLLAGDARRLAVRTAAGLLMAVALIVILFYGRRLFSEDPVQSCRSLEIILTWLCRAVGVLLAGMLSRLNT